MKTLFLALTLLTVNAHAARITSTATYQCMSMNGKQLTYRFSMTDQPSALGEHAGIHEILHGNDRKVVAYPQQVVPVVINAPDNNGWWNIQDFYKGSPTTDDQTAYAKHIVLWDQNSSEPLLCKLDGGGL